MKINVNGKPENIRIELGIADNKPTDWTYELVESCFTGSRDDEGNMVVKKEDFELLKKIEDELKKNNEFSFELSGNGSLKELYNKIKEENKHIKNNKLAYVILKEIKKQATNNK